GEDKAKQQKSLFLEFLLLLEAVNSFSPLAKGFLRACTGITLARLHVEGRQIQCLCYFDRKINARISTIHMEGNAIDRGPVSESDLHAKLIGGIVPKNDFTRTGLDAHFRNKLPHPFDPLISVAEAL